MPTGKSLEQRVKSLKEPLTAGWQQTGGKGFPIHKPPKTAARTTGPHTQHHRFVHPPNPDSTRHANPVPLSGEGSCATPRHLHPGASG